MPVISIEEGEQLVDLALIHLTFEGLQTFGGGVATVTRGHLGAMPKLREALLAEGVKVTPYFFEIAYRKDHPRRDLAFERYATRVVKELHGDLRYLANYSDGGVPKAVWGVGDIGTLENWRIASASGATEALNAARKHSAAIIYCHDIVFALAALYATLQQLAFKASVKAVYVVHSTALTHELPLPNPDRLMVEGAAIHWAKVNPDCKLGYISRFIAGHLMTDYGAHESDLVPAGNGINPEDAHFRQRDREEISAKLRQYGIPRDRPLVVSWGRPVPYKRYDVLLKAAGKLRGKVHPVIVLSEEWPELASIAREELGPDVTLLAAFDAELVASLLQWDKTVAATSLAKREPFGLTPVEVRALARAHGPLIIVSDTGGLVEQVMDSVDGFVTKQDDPIDVARALQMILDLKDDDRLRMRSAGLRRVLGEYTWSSQILKTLSALYPQWAERFSRARDTLARRDLDALGAKNTREVS